MRGKYLPLSLTPVYYYRCRVCEFVHAPEFESWSDGDFNDKIYNNNYIEVDLDYLVQRPHLNFHGLNNLFGYDARDIRHLDWGGGNGGLTRMLSEIGWDSVTYDPLYKCNDIPGAHRYNLITCYEVLEHVVNPKGIVEHILSVVEEEVVIIFSTLIQPDDFYDRGLFWWYCNPRSGHIYLYSKQSLDALWNSFGFGVASFNSNLHVAYRKIPEFAKRIFS